MKANQLATLVLRLLGIYCLVALYPLFNVFETALYLSMANNSGGTITLIVAILSLIMWIGTGILLIVFSVPLGRRLPPEESGEDKISAVSFEQVQMLAFAVAGVLIFSEALPQLLNSLWSFLNAIEELKERGQYPPYALHDWSLMLGSIGNFLKAAVGLGLFFGARGFANFWRSMRNFATPKPPGN
jgi:hypothetical protein